MGLNEFTILNEEQVSGKNKLDIIKKRGEQASITDFSILLGGLVSNKCIGGDDSLEGRIGLAWQRLRDNDLYVLRSRVSDGHSRYAEYNSRRYIGTRIALPFLSFDNIPLNEDVEKLNRSSDDIIEVEYGYYPQKAVNGNMQDILESAYNNRKLKKTTNKYTINSKKFDDYNGNFSKTELDEFEYEGSRYVRVKTNSCFKGKKFKLSNGIEYKDGDLVWIEVSPIKWLVDEKDKIMISDKLLFAGIRYDSYLHFDKDFDKTDIKIYIDNYFSKEIIGERTYKFYKDLDDDPLKQKEIYATEQKIESLIKEKEMLEKKIEKLKNLVNINENKGTVFFR